MSWARTAGAGRPLLPSRERCESRAARAEACDLMEVEPGKFLGPGVGVGDGGVRVWERP